jgi:hypothetical protein
MRTGQRCREHAQIAQTGDARGRQSAVTVDPRGGAVEFGGGGVDQLMQNRLGQDGRSSFMLSLS